jgi:predicted ABC-class ATPase
MKKLKERLDNIHKKNYGLYKTLKGKYSFVDFDMALEHIQGDPFASPSRLAVFIPYQNSFFPLEWLQDSADQVALGDYINRELHKSIQSSFVKEDSVQGGTFSVLKPGPQILARSTVQFDGQYIVVRFHVSLPAWGRKIHAELAQSMLLTYLPELITQCCFCQPHFKEEVQEHIYMYKEQLQIRRELASKGLVGFIPNGAILPRKSGFSQEPMKSEECEAFESPKELEETFELTVRDIPRRIVGMGVRRGLNLIVGGGFHGKSTLLEALERGVYPHVAGDGREYVCVEPNALKVRAESGRVVHSLDIQGFINNLPKRMDTSCFETENASGSTSQAAAILEAAEAGVTTLLMDEDTCATNLMIRDQQMQSLIAEEEEPITPLLYRAQELYQEHGVSSILVMGAVGHYFSEADCVIGMKHFKPVVLTKQAHQIAKENQVDVQRPITPININVEDSKRVLVPDLNRLGTNIGRLKVSSRELQSVRVGNLEVDIRGLEQLVCKEQARTLGYLLIAWLKKERPFSMLEVAKWVDGFYQSGHFYELPVRGDYVEVRGVDLVSLMNRFPNMLFRYAK